MALHTSHTDYNSSGQVADSEDQYGTSSGLKTTNYYDLKGNLIATVYPDGTETRSVYDDQGQLIWHTDRYKPTGLDDDTTAAVATLTDYDSLGNVLGTKRYADVIISIGSATSGSVTLADSASTFISASTQLSGTATVYNAQGQAVETETLDGGNNVILRTGTIFNPDGSVQQTGPLQANAPDDWYDQTNAGSYFTSSTSYTYDNLDTSTGQPWSGMLYDRVTDANDHTIDTYQDADGRTVFTVYDDGSFTQTIYSDGDDAIPGYTIATASGSVLPTIPTGDTETVTVNQHKSGDSSVPYTIDIDDASGNLTDVYEPAVIDGDPHSATFGKSISPHTSYVYDASGNEIEQIDAKGNETEFGYDENGNQVSRTLPDRELETTTYNQFGQEATQTDFDGNVAMYTYLPASDPNAGSLEQVTYTAAPGSGKADQTVSYTYTDLGQPYTVDDNGAVTTDDYDAEGDLIEVDSPQGTINYGYDLGTGEHTSTSTANTDIVYGYDDQGRLTTVTVNELNGTTLATPLITAYTYDAVGNKKTETLPDGEVTTYTYDDLNRLTNVLEQQGSTALFSEQYVLNDDGSRASSAESQLQPDGSTETIISTWSYDADGRLTGEAVSSSVVADSFSDTYTYDLASNRITDVHTGAGGDANGASDTTTSTYNGDDQLAKQVSAVNGETDLTYDANGSELTSTNGSNVTTYGYDVRNKMVSATVNGVTTSYVYDDDGNRVSETVGTGTGAVTTSYLTDENNPTGYAQPLEATSTAAGRETYLIGDRVFGQVDNSGNVSYLLVDGHGSTQAITGASGAVTSTFSYSAFGGAIGFNPATAATPFLFGGDAVYDPASGLYLNGDGTRGRSGYRFIQADTLGNSNDSDPITLHKYLYANADPVSNWDPTGHFTSLNGLSAQAQITRIYKLDHPGDTILSGKWLFGLVPDIQDWTPDAQGDRHWLEVKPLTFTGISDAVDAIAKYSPGALFGWLPDHIWSPSIKTIWINGQQEPIFNAGGIVFYGDNVQLVSETVLGIALLTARSVADFLPQVYEMIGAGQRALQFALGPEIENDLGIATLDGELGAI